MNTAENPEQLRIAQDQQIFESMQILRKAGYAKPDGVPWPLWVGPKKLNHRQELVALYTASGRSATQTAAELGYTQGRISIIMNSPRFKARVEELRQQYYGNTIQGRFAAMVPAAIGVIDGILSNPNGRDGIRLKAAGELLNRAIGKPKETIEIRNTSVKDIFDYLDRKKAEREAAQAAEKKTLALTSDIVQESKQSEENLIIETAEQAVDAQMSQEIESVEAWVGKNLTPLVESDNF